MPRRLTFVNLSDRLHNRIRLLRCRLAPPAGDRKSQREKPDPGQRPFGRVADAIGERVPASQWCGRNDRSRVNSVDRSTIEPSGRISALIPLVAAISVDRPCSTARSREIASCCSVCPVCP